MSVVIKTVNEGYSSPQQLSNLIRYIETDKSTGRKCFYRGYLYTSEYNALAEFMYTKKFFNKCDGRYAKHIIISVDKSELLTNAE